MVLCTGTHWFWTTLLVGVGFHWFFMIWPSALNIAYVISNNSLYNVCTHAVHIFLQVADCPWVNKDDSKQKLYWNASSNLNYCSFHTLTDIIRQFNPLLKGASVTSQSRDNNPYNDDLNVAFVGASARSE